MKHSVEFRFLCLNLQEHEFVMFVIRTKLNLYYLRDVKMLSFTILNIEVIWPVANKSLFNNKWIPSPSSTLSVKSKLFFYEQITKFWQTFSEVWVVERIPRDRLVARSSPCLFIIFHFQCISVQGNFYAWTRNHLGGVYTTQLRFIGIAIDVNCRETADFHTNNVGRTISEWCVVRP